MPLLLNQSDQLMAYIRHAIRRGIYQSYLSQFLLIITGPNIIKHDQSFRYQITGHVVGREVSSSVACLARLKSCRCRRGSCFSPFWCIIKRPRREVSYRSAAGRRTHEETSSNQEEIVLGRGEPGPIIWYQAIDKYFCSSDGERKYFQQQAFQLGEESIICSSEPKMQVC